MIGEPTITAEEFAEGYARRSHIPVERLLGELGRGVRRCYCTDDTCDGWKMVNAKEYDAEHPCGDCPTEIPCEVERFCTKLKVATKDPYL